MGFIYLIISLFFVGIGIFGSLSFFVINDLEITDKYHIFIIITYLSLPVVLIISAVIQGSEIFYTFVGILVIIRTFFSLIYIPLAYESLDLRIENKIILISLIIYIVLSIIFILPMIFDTLYYSRTLWQILDIGIAVPLIIVLIAANADN